MVDETEESLFDAPPMGEQERMVEAILFASAEPVTLAELVARMPHGADPAEALVHVEERHEGRGVNSGARGRRLCDADGGGPRVPDAARDGRGAGGSPGPPSRPWRSSPTTSR